MALKIIITGGSGLLGKYLIDTQPLESFNGIGESPKHNVYVQSREVLDVSNYTNVLEYLFPIQPDIIIHCAANGNVDDVENNSSEAVKSDLLGTINLKDYAEKSGCKLVTISTNAVYDGENGPYSEESQRNPINFYGKIKSLADDIIKGSSCDWMIVRPILMYGNPGAKRGNMVTRTIGNIENGNDVKLVSDSYSQPVYAGDVAQAIWHLIKGDHWNEEFNVASENCMNLYVFGKHICDVFGLDKNKLQAAKTSDFELAAKRPVNTCFDTSKLKATGFECNDVITGLKLMKHDT